MSILGRIRAHGGDAVSDEWRIMLCRGRLSGEFIAWIAEGLRSAVIAALHDKPVEASGGLGTGEYYARRSGCRLAIPPERGDWNEMHQSKGLRAVARLLPEVRPP